MSKELKKEEKELNVNEICNIIPLTNIQQYVIQKKFKNNIMTLSKWKQLLGNERIID